MDSGVPVLPVRSEVGFDVQRGQAGVPVLRAKSEVGFDVQRRTGTPESTLKSWFIVANLVANLVDPLFFDEACDKARDKVCV